MWKAALSVLSVVGASVAIAGKECTQSTQWGYMRSDGGTDNSDFNKWHGYYQGDLVSRYLNLNW